MFSKMRGVLAAVAVVSGLFGASQASSGTLFAPTQALAACYSSVSNQDLVLVANGSGKSIVGHVTLSTWCAGDTVHARLHNQQSFANYDFYTAFTTNGTYQDLSQPYNTTGVTWDAYACGPLNCTADVNITT